MMARNMSRDCHHLHHQKKGQLASETCYLFEKKKDPELFLLIKVYNVPDGSSRGLEQTGTTERRRGKEAGFSSVKSSQACNGN